MIKKGMDMAVHHAPTAKKIGGGLLKGAGKALLVTGAVGAGIAGLAAVTQMLSSPTRPRRLNYGGDMGSEPIAFNGGGSADIGLGALSVPQMGQQAQMGSWVSRLPAMDAEMGAGTPVPGR
jgi:hypothetical protein